MRYSLVFGLAAMFFATSAAADFTAVHLRTCYAQIGFVETYGVGMDAEFTMLEPNDWLSLGLRPYAMAHAQTGGITFGFINRIGLGGYARLTAPRLGPVGLTADIGPELGSGIYKVSDGIWLPILEGNIVAAVDLVGPTRFSVVPVIGVYAAAGFPGVYRAGLRGGFRF